MTWIKRERSDADNTPRRIAFVAHEFGRYPGHGGIATYLRNQIESILAISDLEVHVFCVASEPNYKHPRVVLHRIKGLDFSSQQAVTAGLLEIQPLWVEVADFGALCNDLLIRRALGQVTANFPIVVNHHTGCREIWEWGTGIRMKGCTDTFLRGCHALELSQATLADANVSVSTFLTDYLRERDALPFLHPIFPYFPLLPDNTTPAADDGHAGLRILSLGRFEQRKRQEDLIDAALTLLREGRQVHTTFVGNSNQVLGIGDDYRQICFERIPKELRHHFTFIDFATPESVRHLYHSSDLFCIPSPMENFPTTALEAISMGLPVMGSRWSGVLDMVGDTKILFDPATPEDLTNCLRELTQSSRAQLHQIAVQQQQHLMKLLAKERTTAHRLDVFENILPRTTPPNLMTSQIHRTVVLDSQAGKATRKMVRHVLNGSGDIQVVMGHEIQRLHAGQAIDFVYCPDGTRPEVLQTLVQLMRSTEKPLRDIPLTLSASYSEVLDMRTAVHVGCIGAFAGRLHIPENERAMTSWNEQLAKYLTRSRTVACLHHNRARTGPLSVQLRTCALRVILPFETAHAYHPANSRSDLRILASSL